MEAQFKLGKIDLFTKEQAESMSVEKAFEKAPIIIHQRFCGELVRIVELKENEKKKIKEVPEAMEVIMAVRILERLYPQLKSTDG